MSPFSHGEKEAPDPMTCPLCERKKITEWAYEDNIIWVARCATHRDQWMWVLKRHTALPIEEEVEYARQKCRELFGDVRFRGPATIKDHYHEHIVF